MSEWLYEVARASSAPALDGAWDGPAWGDVQPVEVAQFHARSSEHRPGVQAKTVYDDAGLYVHFRVEDQYVRAQHTQRQSGVCRDSCVEFFVQPGDKAGYFNFEINCGGTILLHYNETPNQGQKVSDRWLDEVRVFHTLPRQVEPELTEPVTWRLAFFVPLALIEAYTGPLSEASPRPGVTWRGNWYKCGDQTSHPHWASWAPVGDPLSFHKPECFGTLRFA